MADLLYYYEAGKVYCARDYAAKANIPRCAACDELIFAAEYTGTYTSLMTNICNEVDLECDLSTPYGDSQS